MERTKVVRGLRIAWSVGWGILCVLLIVLWVRSYWFCDFGYSSQLMGPYTVVRVIGSESGYLYVKQDIELGGMAPFPWEIVLGEPAQLVQSHWWVNEPKTKRFIVPHLLLVLFIAGIAVVPWFCWVTWKFSLRTVLIATTLIAVVLGIIMWSIRS